MIIQVQIELALKLEDDVGLERWMRPIIIDPWKIRYKRPTGHFGVMGTVPRLEIDSCSHRRENYLLFLIVNWHLPFT